MAMLQLFFKVYILLLFSVKAESGDSDSLTPCPTELHKTAMTWVRSAVPVSIVKLFLEGDSSCQRVKEETVQKSLINMCTFVQTLTAEYVNVSSAPDGNSNSFYVLEAMRRADSYSNNVTCNCWMADDIQDKAKDSLKTPAGVPPAVSAARDQITGVFGGFTEEKCLATCKHWEDVCGVTMLLLDFLPSAPHQPCNNSIGTSTAVITTTTATAIPSRPSTVPSIPINATSTTSRVTDNTTGNDQESTSVNNQESISVSESLVFVAIAVVLVAFLGYVGYYNREHLMKQFGGLCGRKNGRPKKKNYKHLMSVKDALP